MWGRALGKSKLIVGLGNPGQGYARHRHNLGFKVVDRLAEEAGAVWTKSKDKAFVCQGEIEDFPVVLAKPQTFMNLSGQAVAPIAARFKCAVPDMIVVHDDLDLALGKVRVKIGGGDGGHKGIRSIADSLRFRDFIRVRLGIGRPPTGVPVEEFVLTSFSPEEKSAVDHLVGAGCEAVRLVLLQGVQPAQNALHGL